MVYQNNRRHAFHLEKLHMYNAVIHIYNTVINMYYTILNKQRQLIKITQNLNLYHKQITVIRSQTHYRVNLYHKLI